MAYSNQKPEVIDLDDPRYKRPEHFEHPHKQHDQQNYQIYTRSFGCTPIGCLPGCLFSILISILLTLLLNLIF